MLHQKKRQKLHKTAVKRISFTEVLVKFTVVMSIHPILYWRRMNVSLLFLTSNNISVHTKKKWHSMKHACVLRKFVPCATVSQLLAYRFPTDQQRRGMSMCHRVLLGLVERRHLNFVKCCVSCFLYINLKTSFPLTYTSFVTLQF